MHVKRLVLVGIMSYPAEWGITVFFVAAGHVDCAAKMSALINALDSV